MIRYEFSDSSIRNIDLHPEDIFKKERLLAAEFVRDSDFNEQSLLCPVCKKKRCEALFTKWGVATYLICPEDWSIGLASSPSEQRIKQYAYDSDLAVFRASRGYQDQAGLARKALWKNLLEWLEGRVSRYMGQGKYSATDWGTRFVGWIEVLKHGGFIKDLQISGALPPINGRFVKNDQTKIVCLIDCIQREIEPSRLLKEAYDLLDSGGLLFLTCRAGSGFDILTLRENSQTIFPLDHIFLPSPLGIRRLLESTGYEVLEVTTPGMMDAAYVNREKDSIPKEQYFQRYLMDTADDAMLERLQGFLQRNNLSSHLRCVARKPNAF